MQEISLLIPGRHHIITKYWQHYIRKVISKDLCLSPSVDWTSLLFDLWVKVSNIIFPITSANHHGTRRNPLDISKRSMQLDRFASGLWVDSFQYMIEDVPYTNRFADHVIKKIEIESQARFRLSPENTVVMSSTPSVIKQFQKLGYQILPAELEPGSLEDPRYLGMRPWELIEYLVSLEKSGKNWKLDDTAFDTMGSGSRAIYSAYDLVPYIFDLFEDGLLGEDGDITATRDYREYLQAFDSSAERKYQQIQAYLSAWKIVDIGCCSGSLIEKMTEDPRLYDADFYWIEVTRLLYEECKKRKEQGYFKNDNVFFLQKNVVENQFFKENSIDIFTSFSLTHEIYSYQSRASLEKMTRLLWKQLRPQWRWINVDVVGPEEGDKEVFVLLSKEDGQKKEVSKPDIALKDQDYEAYKLALQVYLESLSTYERFFCFAEDFRKEEGDQISYQLVVKWGEEYLKLSYRAICEYLSKKDYLLNRESEMHEKFCDFAFSDRKHLLEKEGFQLHAESRSYANEWVIEQRWKGRVKIFEEHDWALLEIHDTPTNVLLIAEKVI